MDTKTSTMCNIEKHINNFYKKYTDWKDCNRARGLKRYYENKEKISNHQKNMKKIEIKYYYRNRTIDVNNIKT